MIFGKCGAGVLLINAQVCVIVVHFSLEMLQQSVARAETHILHSFTGTNEFHNSLSALLDEFRKGLNAAQAVPVSGNLLRAAVYHISCSG